MILGVLAPPTVLAISAAQSSARSASNLAVARGLVAAQVEIFRAFCRLGLAAAGSTTTVYTPVGSPPIKVVNTVTVANVGSYQLATIESLATWTEMRGGSATAGSLQLGTAARNGAAR